MRQTAQGRSGELRIGGRVAAELGAWEAERDAEGWHGYAAVQSSNPVLLAAAGSFELRLTVGTRIWRWRDIQFAGDASISFRATGDRHIIEGV